jgi:hypothetical protein
MIFLHIMHTPTNKHAQCNNAQHKQGQQQARSQKKKTGSKKLKCSRKQKKLAIDRTLVIS